VPVSDPILLGIDIGTTRTKTGLVSVRGEELVTAGAPTRWRDVGTGAETTPADLMASVQDSVAAVLREAPDAQVVGVGVTSIAESMVLVDGRGDSVAPVVAWHDVRARPEFTAMNADFGTDTVETLTGLGTEQIPSVATLRWIARHITDPASCRWALSVAEWVVASLGGDTAAEASLASRTGGLSLATSAWWPDMLAWTGLPVAAFPEVRNAGERWGRVRTTGAGLERLRGAWLTVAGHDHPVGSVGIGVMGHHQVADSCGTAEALMRPIIADAAHDPAIGLRYGISTGRHVLPGSYLLLGGRRLGIDLLRVLDTLGAESRGGLTELDAGGLALGDDGVDRSALVADGHASRAARWRATVAANVNDALELLRSFERIGGPVSEVRVIGGWAHNPLLRQLKAAAFQPAIRPVYPLVKEAGIRGAALLAGRAAGIFSSPADFPPPLVAPDRNPCPAD
jgi:sugar (pentulose or hexulose) kinase